MRGVRGLGAACVSGAFWARSIVVALLAATALTPGDISAQTITWLGLSSDFQQPTNWNPNTFPTSGTIAVFTPAGSNVVTMSGVTVGQITFNAGVQAHMFRPVGPSQGMSFDGVGIVNNSSNAQTFAATFSSAGYSFLNSSTSGNAVFSLSSGGVTNFANSANAGTSLFTVDGAGTIVRVHNTANLASATINLTNGGRLAFFESGDGGTAAVSLSGATSTIDLSSLTAAGTTIGSIAGVGGQIALSIKQLTVGGNNASTTFAGIISDTGGAGSIVKAGSGVWTLTGANTYGGGTTVTAGTLQLGTGGSLASTGALTVNGGTFDLNSNVQTVGALSGSGGAITLGSGVLTTNSGLSTTLASAISGSGALVKQGSGILTLTGNSSYSGGTTALGGLINFAAAGNFGTGAITLNGGGLQWASGNATDISPRLAALGTAGGTFDTNGNTVTLASAITGAGGLTKAGLGTLILTGANSYSGGTTVSGGVLQGTTSNLLGSIANNATVAFNQGSSGKYAGSMSGTGGVTVAGGGTVSFSGANIYTGPTVVTGSGLVVNGSLASAVTLDSASFIGGNGSIGGLTVNGGRVAPGNSIGTLTVNGSFVQNGGTYTVEANAQGQSDRINVNGAATINGGTVQLVAASGTYGTRTTYTIVSATGGVSGTYSGVTGTYAFLTPSLSYTANSVLLTLALQGNAFANLPNATGNQRAVGAALDQSAPTATGNFATAIGALASLDIQQAGSALTAISGEPYTDTSTVAVAASLLVLETLEHQLEAARGLRQPGTRVALAQACDVACDDELPSRLNAWMSGVGGFGSVGGGTDAGTLTYNIGGVAVGIDWRFDPRFLVGAAISYAGGRQWVGGLNGNGSSDNYTAALYASFTQGGFYADAIAGYGYADTQMQRVTTIPGLQTATANGRVGINQFLGQLEMGYGIGVYAPAEAIVTPFARFQTVAASQSGFTEWGSMNALALIGAPQNTTSLRTVLGAALAGNVPVGAANPLAIAVRLGWAHGYANTARPITAAFAGAPSASFTVYGAQSQRDGAVIGLALETKLTAATSIYARYDGEIAGGDNAHVASAGFRMSW